LIEYSYKALEKFSFLAVAILRESLPFEYIACGNQMRSNIEYELQAAEKQREIGYKPVHDSASFK